MNQEDTNRQAARIALARFGPQAQVEPVGGPKGAVFRIRLPESVKILKLGRAAAAGGLRKEQALIERLRREGIPVPLIEHAELDADPPYVLMTSAGDYRAADYMQAPALAAQNVFGEMGVLLARIHRVELPAAGDILAEGRFVPRERTAYLEKLGRLADGLAAGGLIEGADAQLFRSLPMPELTGTNLCHGDFHAVQCIVRDGHVTAVVDWEGAWAGNPAVDFAVAQAYLESYCPKDLLASFVAGYLSQRSLPPGYQIDYLPVRMAQTLALMRTLHAAGQTAYVARAVEMFRGYVSAWNSRG